MSKSEKCVEREEVKEKNVKEKREREREILIEQWLEGMRRTVMKKQNKEKQLRKKKREN